MMCSCVSPSQNLVMNQASLSATKPCLFNFYVRQEVTAEAKEANDNS